MSDTLKVDCIKECYKIHDHSSILAPSELFMLLLAAVWPHWPSAFGDLEEHREIWLGITISEGVGWWAAAPPTYLLRAAPV